MSTRVTIEDLGAGAHDVETITDDYLVVTDGTVRVMHTLERDDGVIIAALRKERL